MKNIYEILKQFGLEVPEDKKAEFEKVCNENYKTKADYDKVVAKRDEYKSSLDTVNERLKEFDGVDVKDLQGQITKLQGDLKAKDDEYAAKEAERAFQDTLTEAIKAAGGRNPKAVKALLDVDKLKSSKDQTMDIEEALKKVKEENDYLFEGEGNNLEIVLPGKSRKPGEKMSLSEAMKYKNEHPEVDIRTLI